MAIYLIDSAHTKINFSVKHMMIAKVHGCFEQASGAFTFDDKNPESSTIEADIDINSINTQDSQRDAHLKSSDFFDAENFPVIHFRSTSVRAYKDHLKVTGDLSIHGVTQSISLEVKGPGPEQKDPWGNIKIAATGSTIINRKDFGLSWNAALEAGGFLVSEKVTVSLDVKFLKQV